MGGGRTGGMVGQSRNDKLQQYLQSGGTMTVYRIHFYFYFSKCIFHIGKPGMVIGMGGRRTGGMMGESRNVGQMGAMDA